MSCRAQKLSNLGLLDLPLIYSTVFSISLAGLHTWFISKGWPNYQVYEPMLA